MSKQQFIRVTKHDVIQALHMEPLTAGQWIDNRGPGVCKVCAVGAVLRHAGLTTQSEEFDKQCEIVTKGTYGFFDRPRPGNWLGALSCVWEYLNQYNAASPEELRPTIINWAEENIPENWSTRIPLLEGIL